MPENTPEVVYGARAIGRVIGVLDEAGNVDERRVHYMLEKGQVEGAGKAGRIWRLSVPAYRRAVHGEAA